MRHIIIAPELSDVGPVWQGGSPDEQGYRNIPLPKLRRHDARSDEYHVYSSETEFKSVMADSAVNAVTESEIAEPIKVVHANSRLADVMDTKLLELIEADAETVQAPEKTDDVIPPQEAKAEEAVAA